MAIFALLDLDPDPDSGSTDLMNPDPKHGFLVFGSAPEVFMLEVLKTILSGSVHEL
jgi:hypothetical protein